MNRIEGKESVKTWPISLLYSAPRMKCTMLGLCNAHTVFTRVMNALFFPQKEKESWGAWGKFYGVNYVV